MTEVHGVGLDAQSRCAHWQSATDVISIRFPCCDKYYACYECHEALEDHEPAVWSSDRFDEPAVLCGVCRVELSTNAYLACGFTCPECGAAFNPGCAKHYHLYFEGSFGHPGAG